MRQLNQLALRLAMSITLLVPTAPPALSQEAAATARAGDDLRSEEEDARSELEQIAGDIANGNEALQAYNAFTSSLGRAQASTEAFRQVCAQHDEAMHRVVEELRPRLERQVRHCRDGLVQLERVLARGLARLDHIVTQVQQIRDLITGYESSLAVEQRRAEAFGQTNDLTRRLRSYDREISDVFRPES